MRSKTITMFCAIAAVLAPPAGAQPESTDALKQEGFAIVDREADHLGRLGDAIFSYAEIGFQEVKTIALVTRELRTAGFEIKTGVAGMPTAYMATYGSGGPVIGLMGDFDGVPGASQYPAVLPHRPMVEGAPGHGEGHNIHQPTLIGAAIALKRLKDEHKLPGTIIVYGGPAEELGASRGYMVNAGVFKGVDAMLDIHIGREFATSWGINNSAIMSVQWTFQGQGGHAASAWKARSALDAVEVMNASTEFMREHVEPFARFHYTIPDGGKQPNVVPAEATTWYYVRHQDAAQLWKLFTRIRAAAEGAAQATGTTVTENILAGSWPFNGNKTLAEYVQQNMELVGMPKWSVDDQAFARAFQKSMDVPITGLPTKVAPLHRAIQITGSSDTGDVTWQAPYVRMLIPGQIDGSINHHWSAAISPATPVAHKGIAAGAKVLVATALDLMTDPQKVAAVKASFSAQLREYPAWKSLIPPTAKPPTFMNTDQMQTYRPALGRFEYDPNSSKTYLESLGIKYPPDEPAGPVGKQSDGMGGKHEG
ncbi:amidohydrolase [Sphingomonas sp. AP4-R1]|uniref:amidohydrolase n=1 Tax=Sphingomonas sp. AP4-R1 TaxID=2735134 RepID=UPI001493B9D1|nr:amidohydrolase [Sphingomonas sp. AP4-R1]QJU58220.1 amidohydrolase [Sphingomonas sp. AP4-R1]